MAELKQLKRGKWLPRWAAANGRAERARTLLREYAELFQSREKSCAVHRQARGSTIGATHGTLTCSDCLYDLIALLSCVFVNNVRSVAWRVYSFFSDLRHLLQGIRRFILAVFSKFRQGSVKRSAPREEHGPLHKILKL